MVEKIAMSGDGWRRERVCSAVLVAVPPVAAGITTGIALAGSRYAPAWTTFDSMCWLIGANGALAAASSGAAGLFAEARGAGRFKAAGVGALVGLVVYGGWLFMLASVVYCVIVTVS